MRATAKLLAFLLLVPSQTFAQIATEPPVPPIRYPETRQAPVVEEHFGHTITDPYRWLETDVREDEEVSQWVEAQNALTQDYLDGLPGREIFAQRMAALLDFEQVSAPVKRNGRYFYIRNSGSENQYSLYMREGIDGPAKLLIDPNQWSDDSGDALAEWSPSDDGRYIAYAVQQGGTDWRSIRVLDVNDGTVFDDVVEWARFTDIAWAPDGSGFFYARFPAQDNSAAGAAIANHSVYFHALGTPQSEDRLVYAEPDNPNHLVPIKRTSDGQYLAIYPTPGAGANDLVVIDLNDPDWTPRHLAQGLTGDWQIIGSAGKNLYATTNSGAERGKLVEFDMNLEQPLPIELVSEDEHVLSNAFLVGDRLIATYLRDAKTEIRRFELDGIPDGNVELPGIGSAGGFVGHPADNEAFFIFTSFDTPVTVFRYDVAANTYNAWAEPRLYANLDEIVTEQHFYTSKDGTRVPVFVVRKAGLSKPAPTLLYAYGGFGIPMLPIYNPMQVAWVEQGGVLAIANIRGGGEYGRAWHMAGQFENRQTAYDDYIAAAEFLKSEGIASPDGLVAQGESNGGLLVGVVTNQRPDMFAAALPGVGVMDMLRFHKFTGGALWAADFGNPEEEEHFNNLLAYSPYHNVREGQDYPAILVTTADTDDRVVPGHSFKYTAAIQAADLGTRPRLIRVESRAGHGAGMPLDRVIALHADQWAFAAFWAGLDVGH